MPRPKRGQVVVGARRERQLVLAAVARAGVDVAQREAAAAVGRAGRAIVRRRRPEVAEEGQHQRSAQA